MKAGEGRRGGREERRDRRGRKRTIEARLLKEAKLIEKGVMDNSGIVFLRGVVVALFDGMATRPTRKLRHVVWSIFPGASVRGGKGRRESEGRVRESEGRERGGRGERDERRRKETRRDERRIASHTWIFLVIFRQPFVLVILRKIPGFLRDCHAVIDELIDGVARTPDDGRVLALLQHLIQPLDHISLTFVKEVRREQREVRRRDKRRKGECRSELIGVLLPSPLLSSNKKRKRREKKGGGEEGYVFLAYMAFMGSSSSHVSAER